MTDDDIASRKPENLRFRWLLMGGLILLLLAALPLAVWLDLSSLGETALRRQASDLNSVISSVRAYYGSNVVGRVLAAHGKETAPAFFVDLPGILLHAIHVGLVALHGVLDVRKFDAANLDAAVEAGEFVLEF